MITHNKVTTNQSNVERVEQVLCLVEYVFSYEDETLVLLKE